MRKALCAVSIDLDEIGHYHGLHGLEAPEGRAANAVYDLALPRLSSFCADLSLPVTLFAVGADMARPANAEALKAFAARGHEIGNHTLDHRYDLTRLPRAELARQIEAGAAVLEGATGQAPVGFRAPGYTVNDAVFATLRAMGARYDASVFPSWPYQVAKGLAMAAGWAQGRQSRAIFGGLGALVAPVTPYPLAGAGRGLVEVPVQVATPLRLPFIGTTLSLLPREAAVAMARQVARGGVVNLELHGVDLLDWRDGLAELSRHQFDLCISVQQKIGTLIDVIGSLRDLGFSFVTMRELADAWRS